MNATAQQNISDELNPDLLFHLTYTELLVRIASGEIDCKKIAEDTLKGRGLDPSTGKWIGFKKC